MRFGFRSSLRDRTHHNAVMIRAGSFQRELPQNRQIEIAEFQQLNIGGDIEKPLQNRR
jgi:hypothetical protein